MNDREIGELESLIGLLSAAAGRLRRVVGLVRSAGDLLALERRLLALVPSAPGIKPGAIAEDETSGAALRGAQPGEGLRGSVTSPDRAHGGCAVFAVGGVAVKNLAKPAVVERPRSNGSKSNAQESRGDVRRASRDSDQVPF